MSTPVVKVQCTQCEFRSSTSVVEGRFAYELPGDARLSLRRRLGWCFDCATIRPVEDLTRDSFEAEFTRLTSTLAKVENELAKSKTGIRALFRWSETRTKQSERNIAFFRKQISEAALYGNLLASRHSPPRCLQCSGQNVIPCELPQAPKDTSLLVTRFVHPDCGGYLTISDSGMRLAVNYPTVRIYSSEGVYLRDDDVPRDQW